jgi:hypothetical protein
VSSNDGSLVIEEPGIRGVQCPTAIDASRKLDLPFQRPAAEVWSEEVHRSTLSPFGQ